MAAGFARGLVVGWLLGGDITLESSPGQGAGFILEVADGTVPAAGGD